MSPPTRPPQADAIPDSPPPDVLDAIALAGGVYERLWRSGREPCFDLDPETGRLRAELRDESGRTLARLSASEVIDLATGADPA